MIKYIVGYVLEIVSEMTAIPLLLLYVDIEC